ncbi:MAG: DUF3382 domain-containing protein, partial [Methyloceanibacter sp.]
MRGPGKALSPRLRSALVDAVIAAGVAFALFCLTLGVRTGDSAQGLTLTPRPLLLATVIGIIFVGRLALNLFWWNRSWRLPKSVWWPLPWTLPKFPLPKVARERASGHFGALALVIFAALFPIVAYALDSTLHLNLPLRYLLDLSILVLTYVMLGWGLNIVVGLAGLLDLGYVAFYAVGAYTFALLATTFGWSFWICLP